MRKRKRPLWLLVVFVLSLGASTYLTLSVSPSNDLSLITYHLSLIPVFLLLLFSLVFSLFTFLLNNSRRGFLLGLLTVSYLILRLNGLTSPFFAILLLILFGGIELFFVKRK
jgi:hypothetical protein